MLAPRVVATDLPADLPLVECDAVLIERVFVNLLENAAKYTPPDVADPHLGAGRGQRAAGRGRRQRARASAAGQEAAIFEKFARGTRESAVGGVGLGLTICKAIVEAHGGTIVAQPVEGGGAALVFTLPLGTRAGVRRRRGRGRGVS